MGFVAFRGRTEPLASTALDATAQIPRRVFRIGDYNGNARKAYLAEYYGDTPVLKAYEAAPRRAMREDLFRLAVIARDGGVSYGRGVAGADPADG
mgnify:CR=1 FL=1